MPFMDGEEDANRYISTFSSFAKRGRMQRSGSRVQGVSSDILHNSGVKARYSS
jgi:hypothetical protein